MCFSHFPDLGIRVGPELAEVLRLDSTWTPWITADCAPLADAVPAGAAIEYDADVPALAQREDADERARGAVWDARLAFILQRNAVVRDDVFNLRLFLCVFALKRARPSSRRVAVASVASKIEENRVAPPDVLVVGKVSLEGINDVCARGLCVAEDHDVRLRDATLDDKVVIDGLGVFERTNWLLR